MGQELSQLSHIDYFHFTCKCSTPMKFFLLFLHVLLGRPYPQSWELGHSLYECWGIEVKSRVGVLALESEQQELTRDLQEQCKQRGKLLLEFLAGTHLNSASRE